MMSEATGGRWPPHHLHFACVTETMKHCIEAFEGESCLPPALIKVFSASAERPYLRTFVQMCSVFN